MTKERQLMLYMLQKVRLYNRKMKEHMNDKDCDVFMGYADRKLAVLSVYYQAKNLYKEEPKK